MKNFLKAFLKSSVDNSWDEGQNLPVDIFSESGLAETLAPVNTGRTMKKRKFHG